MGPLDLIRHPLIFSGITVPEFIRWYFWKQPRSILLSYFAYLRAFVEIFSFVFLIRTLFSPWKQITATSTVKGFNLSMFAQNFTLNIVSRTIGFLFRLVTLTFGLISVVALTVVFGAFYVLWIGFPLLFWVGLGYVFTPLFS